MANVSPFQFFSITTTFLKLLRYCLYFSATTSLLVLHTYNITTTFLPPLLHCYYFTVILLYYYFSAFNSSLVLHCYYFTATISLLLLHCYYTSLLLPHCFTSLQLSHCFTSLLLSDRFTSLLLLHTYYFTMASWLFLSETTKFDITSLFVWKLLNKERWTIKYHRELHKHFYIDFINQLERFHLPGFIEKHFGLMVQLCEFIVTFIGHEVVTKL